MCIFIMLILYIIMFCKIIVLDYEWHTKYNVNPGRANTTDEVLNRPELNQENQIFICRSDSMIIIFLLSFFNIEKIY